MGYTDLSETTRNLILYNYDITMKSLFLFIFFAVSLFYLFYYKPNLEKKTAFWSVMILRVIITGFSFFGLLTFPFILLTLSPLYTFETFFNNYGMIYISLLSIMMFIMLFDFVHWTFVLILRMSGMDTSSDKYYTFKKWYKENIQNK